MSRCRIRLRRTLRWTITRIEREGRRDLDGADAIVRACWDNFVATEPTYVLRDLIAI